MDCYALGLRSKGSGVRARVSPLRFSRDITERLLKPRKILKTTQPTNVVKFRFFKIKSFILHSENAASSGVFKFVGSLYALKLNVHRIHIKAVT